MKAFIFVTLVAAATMGSLFVLLSLTGIAYAQTQQQPSVAKLKSPFRENTQRACLFPAGGWAIVNCSNVAAATSSQLNAWGRYVVQCGDDSYIATGDDATDVADTSDGWVPSGAWLEFLTTDNLRYISCLNKNADSDCRIIECR